MLKVMEHIGNEYMSLQKWLHASFSLVILVFLCVMLRQWLIHFSSASCWLEDLTRRREERGEELCSPPSWHSDCSLTRLRFSPETLRLGKVLLYSVYESGHSQRCNGARSPSRWGLVQGMDYTVIDRSHSGFSRWEADLRKEGLPGWGLQLLEPW